MQYGARAYKIGDIENIGSMGLDHAEVNLSGDSDLLSQVEDLKALTKRFGITYLVHGPNEGDPGDVKHLEGEFIPKLFRIIEGCRELGSPLLTLHFWLDGRFLPGEVLDAKVTMLDRVALEGKRVGVQVCIENLSERPEDLQPLFSRCEHIGMTLDLGHGELLSSGNRAHSFMEAFSDRILHVHVHDNRGGSRVEDDLHLPVGEGQVNFPALIAGLMSMGYDRSITLEVPLDSVTSSLKRIKGLFETLRPSLSRSAKRVKGALDALGLRNRVIEWKTPTHTAQQAAETLGTSVSQIAKSLVFLAGDDPILVIASGVNRVDEKKLKRQLGKRVRKASAEQVKQCTGFTIGGVPPVGHSRRLPTFIDEDLMKHERIWAAAGSPSAVFRVAPKELVSITQGIAMDLKVS